MFIFLSFAPRQQGEPVWVWGLEPAGEVSSSPVTAEDVQERINRNDAAGHNSHALAHGTLA
jgi:hypothetical protein